MPRAVVERLEPEAMDLIGSGASDELTALASVAISLKRLADAAAIVSVASLSSDAEGIAFTAGRAFANGMKYEGK